MISNCQRKFWSSLKKPARNNVETKTDRNANQLAGFCSSEEAREEVSLPAATMKFIRLNEGLIGSDVT